MFTEDEIRQSFEILDMNRDGAITTEDLVFYLEFIGEKATQEEIEEMIRMCDLDGSGEVKLEEFQKMAGGWSLTPLGQAYPPTKELVEKRNYLNKLMMNKEIQEHGGQSPRFGHQDDQQKGKQRQVVGTNLKVVRSEEGQITMQNKQQSSLSPKEIMAQRKMNAYRLSKEQGYDMKQILDLFRKVSQLESEIVINCTFDRMVDLLNLKHGNTIYLLHSLRSPIQVTL